MAFPSSGLLGVGVFYGLGELLLTHHFPVHAIRAVVLWTRLRILLWVMNWGYVLDKVKDIVIGYDLGLWKKLGVNWAGAPPLKKQA